jgi:hypothetical protein
MGLINERNQISEAFAAVRSHDVTERLIFRLAIVPYYAPNP